MAITLNKLAQNLRAFNKNLPDEVSLQCQIVGSYILERLVKETPVDTSRALSNWVVNIGIYTPVTVPETWRFEMGNTFFSHGGIPPYVEGHKGSTYEASSAMAEAVGQAMINLKRPGETIFIVNTVDYIESLNAGSSEQAKAGYVNDITSIGEIILERINLTKPSMFR